MGSVMGDIVPPALGIALSPFPLVPAILLLLNSRPVAASSAFLLGWTGGIASATLLFTELGAAAEFAPDPPAWTIAWARIGLGPLLLLAGVRLWRRRRQRRDPVWIRALESASWVRALQLGLLLSAANPKILLLVAAGGVSIGTAGLTTRGVIASVVAFTVIGSSTVALPPLLRLLVGARILGPLGEAKTWLRAHSTAVVALVLGLIGVVLVAKGVGSV